MFFFFELALESSSSLSTAYRDPAAGSMPRLASWPRSTARKVRRAAIIGYFALPDNLPWGQAPSRSGPVPPPLGRRKAPRKTASAKTVGGARHCLADLRVSARWPKPPCHPCARSRRTRTLSCACLLVGSARRLGSTNFKPKSIRSTTKTMRQVLTPPTASTLCATLALDGSAS